MRSKICSRVGSALCAVAMVLWICAAFFIVSAAGGSGTVKLVCQSDSDGSIRGMRWSAYRVGEFSSDGKLEFQDEFADYPVYLPDMSVSSLQNAANTMENYALIDEISSVASGTSDVNGEVLFQNLDDGVYLFSGSRYISGKKIYTPTPMFVEVKSGETITSNAKFTVHERPSVDTQMYSVKKVWQYDGDYVPLRPTEIEVELYCDNEFVKKITLGEENNWQYNWLGDATSVWRCKELNIHVDYKVLYKNNETQYLLINNRDVLYNTTPSTTTTTTTSTTDNSQTTTFTTTKTNTDTITSTSTSISDVTTASSTDTETSITSGSSVSGSSTTTVRTTTTAGGGGKLPQTGQLWWPVPVLGAGGLIMFTIGWRLNKRK